MNPDQPAKNYNPGKDAALLVTKAGSGDLKTPGAWAGWRSRVKRLPYRVRLWLWRRLKAAMSSDAYEYLKSWCERSGSNDDGK